MVAMHVRFISVFRAPALLYVLISYMRAHRQLCIVQSITKKSTAAETTQLYVWRGTPGWGQLRCDCQGEAGASRYSHSCPGTRGSISLGKKYLYVLDLCVSSLPRGHANLLCIIPIFSSGSVQRTDTHMWRTPNRSHGEADSRSGMVMGLRNFSARSTCFSL
jgi:hypothetical protein